MYQNLLSKLFHSFIVCSTAAMLILGWHNQIIAKDRIKTNKTDSKLPTDFLWCGTSDNNTYLDFCFSSEKVCKDFALKRRQTNGGKLTLCRPTKIK